MEETQKDGFGVFAWVLFSLAILNFFNTGVLRFYVGMAMCLAVAILLLTGKGLGYISGLKKVTFFSLLTFTFIYGLSVYRFQFVDFGHFLMYALSPACFYIAGYYLATRSSDNRYKYLINSAVIVSSAIFGFFCVFYTIKSTGTIFDPYNGSRYITNFWTGDPLNTTLVGVYVSLGIGMLAVLFIKAESKLTSVIKILLSAIFLISAYCVYFLANRTSLVIGVAAPLITLLIIYNKSKALIRVISGIILVCAVFYFSYSANLFDIKSRIEDSPLGHRFANQSLDEDLRFVVWREAGRGLIDYPEGGRATSLDAVAAHNLWLDVGWSAGVIAFIFALIFTISSTVDFIASLSQKGIPVLLKGILISMMISFILSCAVEPIIEGVFTYFLAFCFFVAFVSGMKFEQKSKDRAKIDSYS